MVKNLHFFGFILRPESEMGTGDPENPGAVPVEKLQFFRFRFFPVQPGGSGRLVRFSPLESENRVPIPAQNFWDSPLIYLLDW